MFDALDASDDNICGNVGSCSADSVMLNITGAKVTKNNLGGAGPDTGTETLGYKHIAEQDGGDINLRVTTESEYHPNSSSSNGIVGPFRQISIAHESKVSLKFSFWTPPLPSEYAPP